MHPGWGWAISGLVAAILMILLILWWRRRTLLRTPGTFKARLVEDDSRKSVGPRVIVSYNETSVEVLTVMSISPIPRWSFSRHSLELERVSLGNKEDWVRVQLQAGPVPIILEMDTANCAELSTWHESGPAVGIGVWRDAPPRRQRRRYF